MLVEGLKLVTDAEAEAEAIRSDAVAKVRQMTTEAAKRGEELTTRMVFEAEMMVTGIRGKAVSDSEKEVNTARRRAKTECERLKTVASGRMDRVVEMIVEKVVNG